MGVAGELQIDAKKGGLVDGDGLMGQQHDGARPITPGEGERNVLNRPEFSGGPKRMRVLSAGAQRGSVPSTR
jgi:hypothetical protein